MRNVQNIKELLESVDEIQNLLVKLNNQILKNAFSKTMINFFYRNKTYGLLDYWWVMSMKI